MNINRSMLAATGLLTLGCVSTLAQQITGTPGLPGATTTIDGKQLPPPASKFGGVIKEKAGVEGLFRCARSMSASGR